MVQVKIFRYSVDLGLEKAINEWLAQQDPIEITHVAQSGENHSGIIITVFYKKGPSGVR
jgi:hypothetical protein